MSKSNISRPIVQELSESLHAGIDLGLEDNVVVVMDGNGKHVDRFHFSQDRGGYDFFLKRMAGLRQKHAGADLAVAMEPTNYFWKLLARELEAQGISYHLVNAYTVKKHREGDQLEISKDDRRDARQIAELSRTGHYTQTRLQRGAYEELRQYGTVYDQLQKSIRRERHVLWGLAGQVFPEVFQVFARLEGEACQALLRQRAVAAQIRQVSAEALVSEVRGAFRGQRLMVKKLYRAHQVAQNSIGVVEGCAAIQLAIRLHLDSLQALEAQLARVKQAMTSCVATLPEAPYLQSFLGGLSTALLLAEVGDPQRYQAASQWVKLAGIQPTPNTSGQKQRSRTPMSHHGRARLRTLLYFTCLRRIQYDAHFAKLYAHLQHRKHNPLTKMQAVGVLMNKQLHILWALMHNHSFYDPSFSVSA